MDKEITEVKTDVAAVKKDIADVKQSIYNLDSKIADRFNKSDEQAARQFTDLYKSRNGQLFISLMTLLTALIGIVVSLAMHR